MSKTEVATGGAGYYVIPLGEVGEDWRKVVLVNRLLRLGWKVYRNAISLERYPVGSFFIPLGCLSISEKKARAYIDSQAQSLGISTIFCTEALSAKGLEMLIRPHVAVIYSTGEKWALMAMNVLETMGFDVNALSSEDIRQGALDYANITFIPGGAGSDKATDLGPEGEGKLKEFLKRGGGVLGFCGGVALLAKVKDGWGLIDVERNPGKVPKGMHGPIWIKPEKSDHPLWYGYPSEGYPLAVWYGKAISLISDSVKVLGRYDRPTDDFYVDHELSGSFFSEYLPEGIETLDKVYDGYANPATLQGMVAIAEGEYGTGKIIVGYPHPETSGLEGGFLLLANAIYYVTRSQPLCNSPWLPKASGKSYREAEILALAAKLKKAHSSQVLPIAKDLVKFGMNNLYWTTRPNIAWNYIGISGPFYICERLEAYCDEIMRQLNDIPLQIDEVNAKRKHLASKTDKRVKAGLAQVSDRLDCVYRLSGQALSETLEAYHLRMEDNLNDWVRHLKKILLYKQLLAIMKEKDGEPKLIEEITRKSRNLNKEYIGDWRWAYASQKYRDIFITLDSAAYYLSNLKLELVDISLQMDNLQLHISQG